MLHGKPIIVARTGQVDIELLLVVCDALDALGLDCAPYIYPISPWIEGFDFTVKAYSKDKILEASRRRVGFEEFPLLVFTRWHYPGLEDVYCMERKLACLVREPQKTQEVAELVRIALRTLGFCSN
uniref:Uncharacterized protein n=1 Tax=Fervidicoccus fontis TaxID=683846 RepID=A0A7J3ZKQ5_9CREN